MRQTLSYFIILSLFYSASLVANERDAKKKNLRIALPSKIDSHDPVNAWSSYQHLIINSVYNTLTKISDNNEIVGSLAESWKVSKDLKSYHFKLKENIRFHNGSILKSKDVAFSISRHLWDGSQSRYQSHLKNALGTSIHLKKNVFLKNIVIINDREFTIKLPKPYLPLLSMLSQKGLAIVKHGDPLVGTGPMTATKIGKDGFWKLSKFNDYFGKTSFFDSMTIHPMLEAKDVISAFKNDRIDFAMGMHLREVPQSPNLEITTLQTLSYNHFYLNPKKKVLQNKKFRYLLGRALQEIAWKVENLDIYSRPLPTLLPKGLLPLDFYKERPRADNLQSILKKLNTYSGQLKIVLVERHFPKKFLVTLRKIFSKLNIKIKIKLIKGPQYISILESDNYDIISYPFVGAYYDPDGFFVSLENYMSLRNLNKSPSSFSFYLDKIRHSKDKFGRLKKYSVQLRKIEENWWLVPGYQMLIPIVVKKGLIIPETNFRNTLDLWRVSR